jgi:hypothetical protein
MATVIDDSGTSVPAPSIKGSVLPDPDHPATRAMFAQLVDRMFGESRGCLHLIGYALLIAVAVFGSCFVSSLVQLVLNATGIGFLVWIALMIAASYLLVRLLTPQMDAQLAQGMLRVGRCGSCCHPLVHAPDGQGLTRCSECGAAWQTASIVEVRVPDADRRGASRFRKTLTQLRSPKVRFRDRRQRYTVPRWPAARWLRGGPHASTGRLARWLIIGQWVFVSATAVGTIALAMSVDGGGFPLLAVVASFIVCVGFGVFGPPLLLIRLLSRRGLCPACINPLEPERWCAHCGCAWGDRLPPASPTVPVGDAHPPTAPPPAEA